MLGLVKSVGWGVGGGFVEMLGGSSAPCLSSRSDLWKTRRRGLVCCGPAPDVRMPEGWQRVCRRRLNRQGWVPEPGGGGGGTVPWSPGPLRGEACFGCVTRAGQGSNSQSTIDP